LQAFYSPLNLFEFSRQQSWRSAFQYSSIEIVLGLVKRKVRVAEKKSKIKFSAENENARAEVDLSVKISGSERCAGPPAAEITALEAAPA